MKIRESVLTLMMLMLATFVWAEEKHEHPAPKMPASFEAMKQFLGTWEGKNTMNGKEMAIKAVYKLTSGGTAIEQISMAGSPKEMVSIYHKDGDSVGMTHYCALGNQPYMSLVEIKENKAFFEMKKNKGIASNKEPHMRALTLTLKDKNTLSEEWVFYKDGKEDSRTVFNFKKTM